MAEAERPGVRRRGTAPLRAPVPPRLGPCNPPRLGYGRRAVYPARYQLPELTAHVVALLERRRGALETFDEKADARLTDEARSALADAGKQFSEVVQDPGYWQRTEQAVLEVAVPRYLRLAREQHELEKRRYGLWRGGDVIARAAYAGLGLVLAAVVWRLRMPEWLEALPLSLFVLGPLLPDVQTWFHKRRYARSLETLVDDMRQEQEQRHTYQPLLGPPVDAPPAEERSAPQKTKENA